MTDLATVFLLGPLYFFPLLLKIGTGSSIEFAVLLASGIGTVFWASVVTLISGFIGALIQAI